MKTADRPASDRKTSTAGRKSVESRLHRTAEWYRQFLGRTGWVIPAATGLLGVMSSVTTTKVFLPLWGGLSVFAALIVLTLLVTRRVRIGIGWSAAIILVPFIGEVGVMTYTLLMLAAGLYTVTIVIGVLLIIGDRMLPALSAPRKSK